MTVLEQILSLSSGWRMGALPTGGHLSQFDENQAQELIHVSVGGIVFALDAKGNRVFISQARSALTGKTLQHPCFVSWAMKSSFCIGICFFYYNSKIYAKYYLF